MSLWWSVLHFVNCRRKCKQSVGFNKFLMHWVVNTFHWSRSSFASQRTMTSWRCWPHSLAWHPYSLSSQGKTELTEFSLTGKLQPQTMNPPMLVNHSPVLMSLTKKPHSKFPSPMTSFIKPCPTCQRRYANIVHSNAHNFWKCKFRDLYCAVYVQICLPWPHSRSLTFHYSRSLTFTFICFFNRK